MTPCMKVMVSAVLLLVTSPLLPAAAADAPREIAWAALVPPVTAAPDMKTKGFLANARPPGPDGAPSAAPAPEAGWMTSRSQQPGTAAPPAVVQDLDGQRVRIGGYVVALDFDATQIKEFLLVPFVGACIHVPPPPPNQIIYVKAADGFQVKGQFDPVYVTGTLRTERQFTGLAATGYTMAAEKVELNPQ
jgi:uncharacterized protein